MRVGIDLRDLGAPIVGVGKATLDVLHYLDKNDRNNSYYLYQHTNEVYCKSAHFHKRCVLIEPYAFLREQVYFSARSVCDNLDVFYAPIHLPPFFVPKKTKIVFTVHDIHSELDPKHFPPVMNRYFQKKRFMAIQRADKVIVHTEFVKNKIMALCGAHENKIKLIPRTVSVEHCKKQSHEQLQKIKKKYVLPDRFILYVGSMEPWKRVPWLIARCVEYNKKYNDTLGLVLVGQPGWNAAVVQEIKQAVHVSSNVQWLNYVSKDDLPGIYQLATLFSSCSLWEGFGLIFLEAMQAGLPILAAHHAAIPEVVGNTGLLFEPYNANDYIKKLYNLLTQSDIYNALQANGQQKIRHLATDDYGKEVLRVFESVI